MYGISKKSVGCFLYILIITSLSSFFAGSVTILIEYGELDIKYMVIVAFIVPFFWYKNISEKIFDKTCVKREVNPNNEERIFENVMVNYAILILCVVIYYFLVFLIVDLFEKMITEPDGHHYIVYIVAIITMLPYGDLVSRVLCIGFGRRNRNSGSSGDSIPN